MRLYHYRGKHVTIEGESSILATTLSVQEATSLALKYADLYDIMITHSKDFPLLCTVCLDDKGGGFRTR